MGIDYFFSMKSTHILVPFTDHNKQKFDFDFLLRNGSQRLFPVACRLERERPGPTEKARLLLATISVADMCRFGAELFTFCFKHQIFRNITINM